jgi:uncharacterized protein YecE (DUF72 family)
MIDINMYEEALIGCAGWSIAAASGADFPGAGSHLERYGAVLPAVEINSSFYRPHRPATYARWRDSVPDGFRFSVKMPKEISHLRRLHECDALLDKFLAEAGQLRPKLGCLLLQLPPSLAFDADVAQRFLHSLRRATDIVAMCEPRHASWFDADAAALLAAHDIGYVEADPPVRPLPAQDGRTVYLRLHGSPRIYYSDYPPSFLDALAVRIAAMRQAGKTVWCVFDNTAEGAALPNALSLRSRLVALSRRA